MQGNFFFFGILCLSATGLLFPPSAFRTLHRPLCSTQTLLIARTLGTLMCHGRTPAAIQMARLEGTHTLAALDASAEAGLTEVLAAHPLSKNDTSPVGTALLELAEAHKVAMELR